MMSRVWGRHAPTRSLRKCRRIAEVKSRMDRTFSRIENLWPRDGSCPLPLRSKPFLGNCFQIVKTQKISRGSPLVYTIAVCSERSSYPCLCSGVVWLAHRSWHSITFRRLMNDSRFSMKKAGRSADTTFCFFQAQEQYSKVVRSTTENNFRRLVQLYKVLFVKKKNTAHAAQRWILSGESAAK